MSAKSIFEADGKAILNYHLTRAPAIKPSPLAQPTKHNAAARLASLHFPEDANVEDVLNQAEVTFPWLLQDGAKFVAKPDQLIKRRGKSGLLALNKTWPEAKAWVAERAGKEQKVEHTSGVLRQFLVEPFVPHPQDTEYYININSVRDVSFVVFCVCFAGYSSGLIQPLSFAVRTMAVRSALSTCRERSNVVKSNGNVRRCPSGCRLLLYSPRLWADEILCGLSFLVWCRS